MKLHPLLLSVLLIASTPGLSQEAPPPPAPAPQEQPPPPPEPPSDPELENAKTLFRKGDYATALEAANRVLSSKPEDLAALYIAGVSALRSKRLDEASTRLSELFRLEPAMENIHFHLGHLAFARGDELAKAGRADESQAQYAEAAKQFEAELARAPGHPQSISSRPLAYARAGMVDDAIRSYEAWIQSSPAVVAPYAALGSLYAELGRADDALAVIDRMPKENRKAAVDASYGMARTLYVSERYRESLAVLDKVLAVDPDARQAHALRAMNFARLNDFEAAAVSTCRYVSMGPPQDEGSAVGEVIKKQFGAWATGGDPPAFPAGITPPVVLKRATPRYPEQARRDRIETDVMLLVRVKRDGSPGDSCLVPTQAWQTLKDMGLDEAAAEAVRRFRIEAARSHGEVIEAYVPVVVKFSLR